MASDPTTDSAKETGVVDGLGEVDLWLFAKGEHRRIWDVLGAHVATHDGEDGVRFAVWAPAAKAVSVFGSFCGWRVDEWPMTPVERSGIWQVFVPGAKAGDHYKFAIRGWNGKTRHKADPYGQAHEAPPGHASIVVGPSAHAWGDDAWLAARAERDATREPMSVYELHLASWARASDDAQRPLNYRDIAPLLIEHCRRFGFTHVELLPVLEHPFTGSWGYQVTGYYAPTHRHGSADDLRALIDALHQADIGVLLDWVPAHFPSDAFGLERFDGTALYEHEDPRKGYHPHWQTLIFNTARGEVVNFLIGSALYWLDEFHFDGLRVDAVASMLYLDYGRDDGQWIANEHGGKENLDNVAFLRALNTAVRAEQPGCLMIAEESTSWPRVTHPIADGGLGFHFKWNMGWMHDTLEYFSLDPVHRGANHDKITFAMVYEHSERFVMPLSHDEVVHGKGSLFGKMPGDVWERLANLKLLLTYQFTRPGKPLLFMGAELATPREWNHDACLDWHLEQDPDRRGFVRYVEALGTAYRNTPAFWRRDPDPEGYHWISCDDRMNQVVAYLRCADDVPPFVFAEPEPEPEPAEDDEVDAEADTDDAAPDDTPPTDAAVPAPAPAIPPGALRAVVLNLTPVSRSGYRIGVPFPGRWTTVLDSDATEYGGSDREATAAVDADPEPMHGFAWSIALDLPPLGALVLELH